MVRPPSTLWPILRLRLRGPMGSIPPRRSDEHRRSQSESTHGRNRRIDRRIVVRRSNTAALSPRGGPVLPMGPILLCDSSPGEPAHSLEGVTPAPSPSAGLDEARVSQERADQSDSMFRGVQQEGHEPGKCVGVRRISREVAHRLRALRREAARGAKPYTPLPQGCAVSGREPDSQATAGPGQHASDGRCAAELAQ